MSDDFASCSRAIDVNIVLIVAAVNEARQASQKLKNSILHHCDSRFVHTNTLHLNGVKKIFNDEESERRSNSLIPITTTIMVLLFIFMRR